MTGSQLNLPHVTRKQKSFLRRSVYQHTLWLCPGCFWSFWYDWQQSSMPVFRLLGGRLGLLTLSSLGTLFRATRKPSLEVAPTTLATFSSIDRELWPVTLTFELQLDIVTLNQPGKYLGQRSFRSTVIVRTQTHSEPNAWPAPPTWSAKTMNFNALPHQAMSS